ncbi:MAG TPA: hypothetical protein VGH28_27360 [Polyangiaceae bacterium]
MSESAETNPLPKVSSARAWEALSFPKASPVIRDKAVAPVPIRRLRADGTEEICVEDIMVIVPKATAPKPRAKQPSSEEIGDADIVVEVAAPEFRRPAYSINATQEVLADDVMEVAEAPLPPQPVHRDEIPSTVPWTVDAGDDLEFPTPPQYTGSYPGMNAGTTGPRITNYSATQVFRRRNLNVKVVVGSLSLAASVMLVAAVARLAPTSNGDGPVGISVHAPKTLDTSVRAVTLAYGTAPKIDEGQAISIDSLPSVPHHRYARRWHR